MADETRDSKSMTDATAATESRDFAAAVACGVFVGVMLCSMFVGGIASVGSGNAVATEQDNASFVTDRIVKSSGSVVNVRIDLAGASAATVLIEGQQNDYTANMTVYDATDDGTATLSFDTSQTDQNGRSFDAGDDDLRVQSGGSHDYTLSGTYTLELQTDSTTDAATLTLQSTAVDALTTQTAPGSKFSTLDTIANVSAVATDDQTTAIGDVMILQLSAPELSAALTEDADAETGMKSESESQLLELIRSGAVDIQIRQTNTEGGPAKSFNLSATIENDGLELLSDEGSVYLLIDTNRAVFDRGETTVGIETGDQFEVTVTGNNGLENETTVSKNIRIVPRTASFDTGTIGDQETITVKSDANQTVGGETSVAPGTNLTIQAKANGNSSFVITRTAQVQPNGTFALNFDFTNVTKGTHFEFMIPNQGFTDSASVSGVVRRPSTASVRISNQNIRSNDTQTVVIRSVDLSDGGFVAVYDQSFFDSDNKTEPSDALRGTSQYLTADKHTNVTIPLDSPYANSSTIVAVPYLDTNDNKEFNITGDTTEDEPYSRADGGPVATSANVSVGDEGYGGNVNGVTTGGIAPTSLDSTINSSTVKNTTRSGAHPADNATEASSDTKQSGGAGTDGERRSAGEATAGQGSGFGLIVGLVAIGVLALLALRRSHSD